MIAVRVGFILWLLIAGLASAQTALGTAGAARQTYAGLTLGEALQILIDQGLELVFTERLVRPEMRIDKEPGASESRQVLLELLRPHALTVREGAGGVLIVVPAEYEVATIHGLVQEWRSGRPLSSVEVQIAGTNFSGLTAADGTFRIEGVNAGSHSLQASRPGYMVLQAEIQVQADRASDIVLELRPTPMAVEEIDVHAHRAGLLGETISALRLDRQELFGLPRLGEDVLRPVTLLPGTAGNDLSARFHVRGGRTDEVMVQLDGFEILEPYHLQDFNNALGIVSPDVVAETELLTGAFPVEYGDRMSGVLALSSREPDWRRRTELGLSVLFAEASGSGTLKEDLGHWLAALRAGSLEPIASLASEEENPSFFDLFGKIARTLDTGSSLRGNILMAQDQLDFTETLGEVESDDDDDEDEGDEGDGEEIPGRVRFRTKYINAYAWASHQTVLARDLYVESKVALSRIERDRQGIELSDTGTFTLNDFRRLEAGVAGQDWSAQVSDRQELKWGFEARFLEVDFDYVNDRELDDPLAVIGHRPPEDSFRFDQRARGQHYAVYLADRWRPGPKLTVEAGLRYDKNTILDDSDFSPRLSAEYQVLPRSQVSLAWGFFHQSQRLYELQVEDGETRYFPSERSEHRVLGFEHTFGNSASSARRPALRLELYEHRISDPRPRFENLYDPISLAPETEPDRVRIAPESSRARGLELFLTGGGRRFDWFASYSRSRIEDRIGGRDVVRSVDQPDAVKLGWSWRMPRQWQLNLAMEVRSGWPTTQLGALVVQDDDETDVLPILGPLYGERLPTYRRLDVRASRRFSFQRSEIELLFDIQNVTDVDNVRGFDVSFGEAAEVEMNRKLWSGIAPSFGIRWAFR